MPEDDDILDFLHSKKSWLVALLCLSARLLCAGEISDAQARLGQKIYRDGTDGSPNPITLTLGNSGDAMSATTFPCANCHGLEGEGKQEGGLKIPAISAAHLLNTTSKQTYDEAAFKRVITQGINADNKPLSAAMPRYRLSGDAQTKALWVYLKQLGTDQAREPGVAEKEIKLATLLPLSGPLASMGNLLHQTLLACITETNQQGLIYGRKLVLAVQDSGNTNEEILAGLRHINAETKPFAVLSSYLPEMTDEMEKLIIQESLPVIAPITFEINGKTDPGAPVFYFLPDHLTQAQALIDYWRTTLYQQKQQSKPRLILISSGGIKETRLAETILNRFKNDPRFKKLPPDIHHYADITKQELIKAIPDAILLLGGNKALASIQKSLDQANLKPVLLGLSDMLGAGVGNFQNDAFTVIILVTPYATQSDSLKQLANKLDQYSVKIENPGLQSLACSAVNLVAYALKQSGKHLTRTKFLKKLEEINGFQTGITPPLYYQQGVHHFRSAAYLYKVAGSLGTSVSPIGWYSVME